jgi:methylmalonyl-CoA mutase N-terminal domain/subunit
MAAVFGGCQSLHTNAKDEALALPTEASAKLALRTQQVIAYESGIAETVDALAGSYYVEYLTDSIESKVNEYLEKIESMGGAVKCIELGYQQEEIAKSAYEYEKQIESNQKIIVGVNEFIEKDDDAKISLLQIDESIQKKQIERLQSLKSSRDNAKVQDSLNGLRNISKGDMNIIPYILNCVENYCTLGEVAGTLRNVWGEYTR